MRRSEVVNLIDEYLIKNCDSYGEIHYDEADAESILRIIEETGMLPPAFGRESTTVTELAGISVEHPLYTIRNQWEPEE